MDGKRTGDGIVKSRYVVPGVLLQNLIRTYSIFAAGSGTAKVTIAEWTDPRTNTTYQFRTYVPQSAQVKLGESVDVLIDPEHPERYTVTSVESISMKKR
jgi:hypothetical protein